MGNILLYTWLPLESKITIVREVLAPPLLKYETVNLPSFGLGKMNSLVLGVAVIVTTGEELEQVTDVPA